MALKPLTPPPTESLGSGLELVASAGGRSNQGLGMRVTLFNGTSQGCRTLVVGDPAAQQDVAAECAGMVGLDTPEVVKALVKLAVAVEGVLRQMDAQGSADDHPSQATRLVTLALDAGAELFHTPEGDTYATIEVDGHHETWPPGC